MRGGWLPLVGGLLCSAAVSGTPKKPNILFIGTDQQRTSTLGCYGNAFAHSPNLDRLASQGVLFTDAYTVSPVCSPSRTSTLLGVHVPIHGVYENGVYPHNNIDSLTPYFDVLKRQGYATALIGKVQDHCRPLARPHPPRPPARMHAHTRIYTH